jgi:Protein of unknown function (DUF2877)
MPVECHRQHGAASSTVLLPVVTGPPISGRLLGASPAGLYVCFDRTDRPTEGPVVIALLPTSSVRLPVAMVTSEPLPVVHPDDAIVVGDGALHVGPHVWRTLRWFDPHPSGYHQPRPSALAQAAETLWNLDDSEVGLPAVRAWDAATALANGDPEPCRDLLGAGPGLTPAGDDVVAGAMAACALSGQGPHQHELEMLVVRARIATTALSAALLSCAARGQVVPEAAELLRVLGSSAAIAPALNRLRSVGSTSGTALAIGLVAAMTVATAQLDPQPDPRGAFANSVSATERPQSWAVAP